MDEKIVQNSDKIKFGDKMVKKYRKYHIWSYTKIRDHAQVEIDFMEKVENDKELKDYLIISGIKSGVGFATRVVIGSAVSGIIKVKFGRK